LDWTDEEVMPKYLIDILAADENTTLYRSCKGTLFGKNKQKTTLSKNTMGVILEDEEDQSGVFPVIPADVHPVALPLFV
jgi:hypothetical protein